MKARLIFCAIVLMPTACSNQWRTSDAQVDSATMYQWLNEAQGTTAQSNAGSSVQTALTMTTDPNTTIYFADAPGPMGTVASVLAFDSLTFLGASPDLYWGNISQVRVFFLDNPFATDGHTNVLLVGIGSAFNQGQFEYYGFEGSGRTIDDGEFSVNFTGTDGRSFTVRSFDTDGDSLNPAIQLRVYSTDSDGGEIYLGKFSTLAGFQ